MNKVLVDRELLPCPFCGGEARLDQRTTQSLWNSSDAVFSHVACDECDISGQDFCDDPNGEEASEWWNHRAQPAEVEGAGDWSGLRLAAKVAEEDGPWEPRLGMTNVETAFAQSASPTKVMELIAALSAVTAEAEGLRKERDRFRAEVKSLLDAITAMAEARDQLRAEVEGLRKALEQFADDGNWCYDTCNISRDVAKDALVAKDETP